MNEFRRRVFGENGHKYTLLGKENVRPTLWTQKHTGLALIFVAFAGIVAVLVSNSFDSESSRSCDTTYRGYECRPDISRYWGQYSPYFSVPSEISAKVPSECSITFVQVLSRHGARDPTASKTEVYNATIHKLQANVKKFSGKYAFLADYKYTLGADQLTTFGEQQLVNSGVKFYQRYGELARDRVPFVRSSGQERVINSARNWTQGVRNAIVDDPEANYQRNAYPHVDVIISEDEGMNNTLHHNLCPQFENGAYSTISGDAGRKWANVFASPIRARLNADLPGANLTMDEVIYIMDLCPFNTVASATGKISLFCDLFSDDEWHQYNYYETLGKFYGYSFGNPLGPTQGSGFVNEVIARMTDTAVHDHTSTNHTLNENPKTFPLGRQLYADFSHDNDMTAIFSAFGLYKDTSQLPNDTIVEAPNAHGFSTAWIVPFAARAYFEKMKCEHQKEELVRILVNDRVIPLTQCNGDNLGRCNLTAFIDSLAFAKSGGHWDKCFP